MGDLLGSLVQGSQKRTILCVIGGMLQLERMVFKDESASKTPEPPESTKKDCKKKEKKTKRKRNNKKKKEPMAVEILWRKKSIFFSGCRIGKIIC